MSSEVPLEVKAISILRNHLELAVAEITSLLGEEAKRPEHNTIDRIRDAFPQDLQGLLYFEDVAEYIIIKPRQYLGSDNFGKIASIVRDQLRGEYISAGQDSHFRVSKTAQPTRQPIPQFDPEDLMKHAWKGKRIGQGQYTEGSLAWGWDYADKFQETTIKILKKDAIFELEGYQFSLEGKIVQTQKIR